MLRWKNASVTRRAMTAAGALVLSLSLGVLASACGSGASGSSSGGGAATTTPHQTSSGGNGGPAGGANSGSGGVSF